MRIIVTSDSGLRLDMLHVDERELDSCEAGMRVESRLLECRQGLRMIREAGREVGDKRMEAEC